MHTNLTSAFATNLRNCDTCLDFLLESFPVLISCKFYFTLPLKNLYFFQRILLQIAVRLVKATTPEIPSCNCHFHLEYWTDFEQNILVSVANFTKVKKLDFFLYSKILNFH